MHVIINYQRLRQRARVSQYSNLWIGNFWPFVFDQLLGLTSSSADRKNRVLQPFQFTIYLIASIDLNFKYSPTQAGEYLNYQNLLRNFKCYLFFQQDISEIHLKCLNFYLKIDRATEFPNLFVALRIYPKSPVLLGEVIF